MSFILDALKKSETERQRADAPALYEVKMAPPRSGVATWLIVLAALLVVNIGVLSVVLLRGSHGSAPLSDPAPPVAAPAPAPVVAPPVTYAPAPAPQYQSPPPAAQAAPPTVVVPNGGAQDPSTTDVTAGPPPPAPAARPSDDDAPAVDAPRAPPAAAQAGSVRATGPANGELPSYQQLAGAPGINLPDLTLNLHAYAVNPADRFIFLNMTKLREGQTSPQGVVVQTITPDGAVLSWHGSQFLLQRQ